MDIFLLFLVSILFTHLITLDLPSVTYLFQVFIFLWEESKSAGPLTLKSLNKIVKAGNVRRTKELNRSNIQFVLQLVSWEEKVKLYLKKSSFLQATHYSLLKFSSDLVRCVAEFGYICGFFPTLKINLVLPFFLK